MDNYQKLFNSTLTKIRYAVSGAVMDSEPLMRTIVKIMYNFSDDLKKNKIIAERTNDNAIQTESKNNNR